MADNLPDWAKAEKVTQRSLPDWAQNEKIAQETARASSEVPPSTWGETAIDVAKQIPSSLVAGTELIPSILPSAIGLAGRGVEAVFGKGDPEAVAQREQMQKLIAQQRGGGIAAYLPEPQTKLGQYTRAIGEMVPASLGAPGSLPARLGAAFFGGAGQQAGEDIAGPVGGAIGGLAGGLVPSVAGGAAAATRGFLRPEEEALRRVGAMAARPGGLTPQEFATTPSAMIADVGQAGKLVRPIANISPESRDVLATSINDRFAGQGERMGGTLRNITGAGADPFTTKAKLQAKYDAERGVAYGEAYVAGDREIWSPRLEQLVSAPAVQGAMRGAVARWRDWQVLDGVGSMNPPIMPGTGRFSGILNFQAGTQIGVSPNLQFWDYTARNLAGAANKARVAGNTTLAAQLGGLERALKKELDVLVPEFGKARGVAANYFGGVNAIEAGSEAVKFKGDIREFAATVNKMKPAERAAFTESYLDGLAQKVEQTPERYDATSRLFQNKLERQKLGVLVGPQGIDRVQAMLRVENIFNAARKALGNSTTVQQLVELGLSGGVGFEEYMRSGGSFIQSGSAGAAALFALKHGGMSLLMRSRSLVEGQTAKEVARLLVSDDPADLKRALDMAAKDKRIMSGLQRLNQAIAAGAITGGVAATESARRKYYQREEPPPETTSTAVPEKRSNLFFDMMGNLVTPANAMEMRRNPAEQFRPGELQGGGGAGGGGLAEWQRAGKTSEMSSVEFARGLSNERELIRQRIGQIERDRRRLKVPGEDYPPNGELQQLRTRLQELERE